MGVESEEVKVLHMIHHYVTNLLFLYHLHVVTGGISNLPWMRCPGPYHSICLYSVVHLGGEALLEYSVFSNPDQSIHSQAQ